MDKLPKERKRRRKALCKKEEDKIAVEKTPFVKSKKPQIKT